MIISGTTGWIIGIGIYATLIVLCMFKEHLNNRHLEEQRRLRREQQNREWREQFNQLSPTIRAAIRMMREDQRDAAHVIALLQHYNFQRNPRRIKRKERVNWKKEGF